MKGAPGAGAGPGTDVCPPEGDGPLEETGGYAYPPEGFACGGGVRPGSGGTGPFGAPAGPLPAAPPDAPGPAAAPGEEDSPDAPAPGPCPELPEAFCVYQAGGA
ncbi:hypothetical protein SUDANB108_05248 [Streptomyces sp. enrichment culture]